MSFSPVLTNVLKGNRRQVFRVFHLRPVPLYESRRLVDSVTIHISAYAEGVTRSNVSASRRTAVLAWLPAPLDSLSSSEGLVKVAGYLAWTDDGVI